MEGESTANEMNFQKETILSFKTVNAFLINKGRLDDVVFLKNFTKNFEKKNGK